MAIDSQNQIKNYKNLEDQLKNTMNTTNSVAAQEELLKVEKKRKLLENNALKERWYGPASTTEEETAPRTTSLLQRGLKLLNAPMTAVVGAAEIPLGKGSVSGIKNITANVEEGGTWGDLLRSYNVNNAVAMPLGFAMDVALDPLVWATGGATAIVPRVGLGIGKAGLKGAGEAIASNVLKDAATVTGVASKLVPKLESTAVKLGTKAMESGNRYNKLVGRDVMEILAKPRTIAFGKSVPLGDLTEEVLSRSKLGRSVLKTFKLGNRDWFEESMMSDMVIRAKKAAGQYITGNTTEELGENVLRAVGKDGFNTVSNVSSIKQKLDKVINPTKSIGVGDKNIELARIQKVLDLGAIAATDGATIARTLGKNLSGTMTEEFLNDKDFKRILQRFITKSIENGSKEKAAIAAEANERLASLNTKYKEIASKTTLGQAEGVAKTEEMKKIWDDYKRAVAEVTKNETGVEWFDKSVDWWKNFKVKDKNVGLNIANAYEAFIGTFKNAKVPWNPSAYTNAVVGNLVMGQMAGLEMHNPAYMKSIVDSFKFIRNKMTKDEQIKYLQQFTNNNDWVSFMEEFPQTFKNVFGVDSKFLRVSESTLAKDALDEAMKYSKLTEDVSIDALKEVEQAIKLGKGKAKGPRVAGAIKSLEETANPDDVMSSLFTSEFSTDGFQKMMNAIDNSTILSPMVKKGLKWYFEKPMDLYSSFDQSYKLGTALKMTNVGLTEREILTLKNFIAINPKDVIDTGTGLYKLKPMKAVEAAQEVYMNYGAMPGAVKVLRSLPFMGSPFASFMYGMGVKTGKTLEHNPAVFNKISNLLTEFQGGTTPLERQKLNDPYFQWYQKDGMIKLPFFKDNPVYMNVANMIPYYAMNMLQPSERKYDDPTTNAIMSTLDKSPFFKTPEGQIMLDYFIQPIILRESNPVGMFGQPLWPQDASALEKSGYMTRQAVETVMPGATSLAGLPQGIIAPEATKYIPNFRWRQLAYATQGKTSLGITGKESPESRTLRTVMSTFGLPYYKMDMSWGAKSNKK